MNLIKHISKLFLILILIQLYCIIVYLYQIKIKKLSFISSLVLHSDFSYGLDSYAVYYSNLEDKNINTNTNINKVYNLWIDKLGSSNIPLIDSNNQIKLITYNVLGPLHGESIKHHYAPMKIRKWTRRRDQLLKELRNINADIYCLQEVSQKALKETFIPGLKHIGLECCGFAPTKTNDVKGKQGHKYVSLYNTILYCFIISI